jgi:hypothetical protein
LSYTLFVLLIFMKRKEEIARLISEIVDKDALLPAAMPELSLYQRRWIDVFPFGTGGEYSI